jgi:reactive intermediate/imine deaminase
MSNRSVINAINAPAAIGVYSQAIRVENTVYLAGQIGLDPNTMSLVDGIDAQIDRVFENIRAVVEDAGGSFDEIVKITVYLTDLANYSKVDEAMKLRFFERYPARAVVGVAALPRGALIEIDAIMELKRLSLGFGVESVG